MKIKAGPVVASLMLAASALPARGESYKYTYAFQCSEVWPAVKTTLGVADNYAKVKIEDDKMKADYAPKHTVHFDVSGVILQRMNHVTLVPKGTSCEMDVVSNYSGWGHEDQGDFKKRVDAALLKPGGAPAEAAKPGPAGK
jgi:hypothetical protein